MRTPELTDWKREAVNDIIPACRYGKNRRQFLPEQFRSLQKISASPVKTGSAAQVREKMSVISLNERIPCLLGVNTNHFTADAQGDDYGIRHFCGGIFRLCEIDTGEKHLYKSSIIA